MAPRLRLKFSFRPTNTSHFVEAPYTPPTPPLSSTSSRSDRASDFDYEERDCFRSMRGVSCLSDDELASAMKKDASELSRRLKGIRQRKEEWTRVFDKAGQGYTITVHEREVNLTYMDDRGEYHHHIFDDTKRRTSIQNGVGQTLLEISPKWVRVYHAGGVWKCRRSMGKVVASVTKDKTDFKSTLPKRRRQTHLPRHSISLETHGAALDKPELLLCSNTPPERLTGDAPKAFRSQFHDL